MFEVFQLAAILFWGHFRGFPMAQNCPTFDMSFSTSNSTRNSHKTFCCNFFEVRVFWALYWLECCKVQIVLTAANGTCIGSGPDLCIVDITCSYYLDFCRGVIIACSTKHRYCCYIQGRGSHSARGANAPPTFRPMEPRWEHAPPTFVAVKCIMWIIRCWKMSNFHDLH